MNGSTIIAVASVVSSAVVGLWVPSFTARRTDRREALRADRERARQAAKLTRERLRLEHQSVEGDLVELRELLDAFVDASFPLFSAVVALQSSSSGDPAPDPGKYSSGLETHRERREQVINLQTRMIVRLGREHAAPVQAGRFVDAADDASMPVEHGHLAVAAVPERPECGGRGASRCTPSASASSTWPRGRSGRGGTTWWGTAAEPSRES